MPLEVVTLRIDGVDWLGWQSAEVVHQMDALANGFSLGLNNKWEQGAEPIPIASGMACEVLAGSDVLITGNLNKVGPSFSFKQTSMTASGRDTSADMVDCAAVHKPGHWKGLTVLQLGQILAKPFGVTVRAEGDVGKPLSTFKLEPGEKAFDALHRALKHRSLLARSDGKGGIIIGKPGALTCKNAIIEGENLKSAGYESDDSERFSDYIVQSQQAGSDLEYAMGAAAVVARCKDPNIKRYRPTIIRPDKQGTTAEAQKLAQWEAATREAKGTTVSATVYGWRGIDGALWPVNSLVDVDIPYLRLKQQLLISRAVFRQTRKDGTTTALTLKSPKAYDPGLPVKETGQGNWDRLGDGYANEAELGNKKVRGK